MSNGPERLEQAIYHGEQYVKASCKQLLGQIHQKIYEAVKQKHPKLIHEYFQIMNQIFPKLHSKVFDPKAMDRFFQAYGRNKIGHGLDYVAGVTIYYDEHQELGVPCLTKDSDDIVLVTGQWLHKSYDKSKSITNMVPQEVRTLLKDVIKHLAHGRMKNPQFMFELERILIQMV